MASKLKTLTARLVIILVIVHSISLPILFNALFYIVEQSHKETFVDYVRTSSLFLAERFHASILGAPEKFTNDLLVNTALSGNCIYAELLGPNQQIFSSNLSLGSNYIYKEDFSFGEHDDEIYFLSIPINFPDQQILLRLGFDEKPTNDQIRRAYQNGIVVLCIYFVFSLFFIIVLSVGLIRPLRSLQRASNRIASGQYSYPLYVKSEILEIKELSINLEFMRKKLVGSNEKLKNEINHHLKTEKRRQVLEDQLLHSQKLEMIGTLSGGIAHEFNNILLPILLYTELAKDALPKNSPIRGDLKRVLIAAERAKNLVSKILAFSRQDSGTEFKPVELQSVINESVELIQAIVPSTIKIRQHNHIDDSKILADSAQIQQLIVNLCNNAVTALNDDGGIIELNLVDIEILEGYAEKINLPPGEYIRMDISDTGHGMDQLTLKRIFEPFFTTRDVGVGSGLGLSVVHGIVLSHGGSIRVFSNPGKGTVFQVYFPRFHAL